MILYRSFRQHVKHECRVELNMTCVKFKSYRCTPTTDNITCRIKICRRRRSSVKTGNKLFEILFYTNEDTF